MMPLGAPPFPPNSMPPPGMGSPALMLEALVVDLSLLFHRVEDLQAGLCLLLLLKI